MNAWKNIKITRKKLFTELQVHVKIIPKGSSWSHSSWNPLLPWFPLAISPPFAITWKYSACCSQKDGYSSHSPYPYPYEWCRLFPSNKTWRFPFRVSPSIWPSLCWFDCSSALFLWTYWSYFYWSLIFFWFPGTTSVWIEGDLHVWCLPLSPILFLDSWKDDYWAVLSSSPAKRNVRSALFNTLPLPDALPSPFWSPASPSVNWSFARSPSASVIFISWGLLFYWIIHVISGGIHANFDVIYAQRYAYWST